MGSAQPATSVAGPSFAGRSGHDGGTLAATPRRSADLRPPPLPPTEPPPTESPPTEPRTASPSSPPLSPSAAAAQWSLSARRRRDGGRCDPAVERAAGGHEVAGPAVQGQRYAKDASVCAAAVQVQRARVRAYLLMFQARGSCRCTMIYVVMLRYYCRYGSASK